MVWVHAEQKLGRLNDWVLRICGRSTKLGVKAEVRRCLVLLFDGIRGVVVVKYILCRLLSASVKYEKESKLSKNF